MCGLLSRPQLAYVTCAAIAGKSLAPGAHVRGYAAFVDRVKLRRQGKLLGHSAAGRLGLVVLPWFYCAATASVSQS